MDGGAAPTVAGPVPAPAAAVGDGAGLELGKAWDMAAASAAAAAAAAADAGPAGRTSAISLWYSHFSSHHMMAKVRKVGIQAQLLARSSQASENSACIVGGRV